jgi:nondiscriminating aspartyl-tRNA synthetase
MMRSLVRELIDHVDEEVTICGWVNATRRQRTMQFLIARDHTGLVQVTHPRSGEDREPDPLEIIIDGLTNESAVKVTGRVVANPIVNLNGLELLPTSIEVLSRAESPLPVDEHTSVDQRLDWRFLDLRRPSQHLVFEVQATIEMAMREVARREGFTEIHTPKLMSTASESGAEVFEVKYFDSTAYLAQSPQFYKQMAIAGGIDRVFEIGPVFRAEPSFTARHATEFTGVDVEMAWIDGVEDVMAFEERMLAHVCATVADLHGDRIAELLETRMIEPTLPFPRMTMAEAIERLRKDGWDPEGDRQDLDPDGERRLSALVRDEIGHDFVFVTRFPAEVRPFYHLRPSSDPTVTESYDLLWNGIEIATGAQREHRYDVLTRQAAEKGMQLEPLSSYINCFRFGTPPHGGFGLGLSRLLMVALGLSSIREATFLFRGPHRLTP